MNDDNNTDSSRVQKHIPQPDPIISNSSDGEIQGSNTEKDPDEWVTGNEPMTGAQKSYLKTLSDEAGESFDENLSKAEASKRIDALQHKTGRGLNNK